MENIKDIVCKNCMRYLSETSLKLVEIERLMGVSNSTVQRWKNGTQAPELDKIDKLASILGVRPIDFFLSEKQEAEDDPLDIVRQILSLDNEALRALKGQLGAIKKGMEKRKSSQNQPKSKNA